MMRRLAREAGADLLLPARLRSLVRDTDGMWQLVLGPAAEQREIRAAWLIDATGRAAHVARRLGARTIHDDRQVAFTALFIPTPGAPEDQDSLTLVESVPDGWWYTALLPARRRVVAFLTDSDLGAARAAAQPTGFDEILAQTRSVRSRLNTGAYRRDTAPRGSPAASSHLVPSHGDGWVAIGDAALAFDPLSSQGILTALYGGLRVARAIGAELAGAWGSVAGFGADLHRVYAAYLQNRRSIYAEERRWVERDFWRRRVAGSEKREG